MSKKKETGKVILVPEKSGAKTSKILCRLRKNRKKCILKKKNFGTGSYENTGL